jgi:hypothetical protein
VHPLHLLFCAILGLGYIQQYPTARCSPMQQKRTRSQTAPMGLGKHLLLWSHAVAALASAVHDSQRTLPTYCTAQFLR